MLALLVAGCQRESSNLETRRRAAQDVENRRQSTKEVEVDTTSLVTPVGGDSLIGTARGLGGEATLRSECAACHEGVHKAPLGRAPEVSLTCLGCHDTSHQVEQSFYAGLVRGARIHPDTMFVTRVSCAGCHNDSTFAAPHGPQRLAAMDRMCTSCHGRRFSGMLARWRTGVEWRSRAVAGYVSQAAGDARLAGDAARSRVRGARQAVDLLQLAGPVHNVRGADQLFRAALDSTASAYARAGVAAPARPALGPSPATNGCVSCHYGVETARKTVFDESFDHATHLVRSAVACKECHSNYNYFAGGGTSSPSVDRDVDARHGKTTLTKASCESCHHAPTTKVECTACHATDARLKQPIRVTMALTLQPEKAPRSRAVAFQHSQHEKTTCAQCHTTPGAVKEVSSCASCHADHHKEKASGCAQCHGNTMLADHKMDTHYKCVSCHVRETVARLLPDRAFCLSCHVKQVTHEPGRECAPCHLRQSPTEVRRRILAAPVTPPGKR
ncbi:MAG: cytochrome c3 family protein [Gemmatimonadaceae bacterium]|nr:cytochrome c3 family protein [Gemmatimonadaceae bacterium]